MNTTTRTTVSRHDYWREVITEQESSGQSVRRYCGQRGIAEQSFYFWRRRLREQTGPIRFALVETGAARQTTEPLELILATGERLRITAGIDAALLRTVVEALRS